MFLSISLARLNYKKFIFNFIDNMLSTGDLKGY